MDILGGIAGCLLGAAIALVAYIRGEQGTLEIGLAVAIASVIYLLFRNRIANSSKPSPKANKSFILILNIIFFCTFAASIYLMNSATYRPLTYFLLTSISVAIVAAEILCVRDKTMAWPVLVKILLLAISLRYGLLYELPGFYGVDPWWHSIMVGTWLDNGELTRYIPYMNIWTDYIDFPIMHLEIMATRLITSLGSKDSLFFSVGMFYSISILFVFLLGQRLIDTKTGLLAVLVISFTSFHIGWGAWLIPMALGVAIFSIILWLIFKASFTVSNILLILIMSFVLVLTHTIAAFVAAITIALFAIANEAYKGLRGTSIYKMYIGSRFVALFWVILLVRWFYSFRSPSRSFFDSVFKWFVDALRTDIEYVGTAFEPAATTVTMPLVFLNRVALWLFIGFIVIGSLVWLSRPAINNRKVAVIVSTFGLSVVCFVFPFFNIETMIPGRWLVFIAVLGAVVVAEGILGLSRIFNGTVIKTLLAVLIIFIFSMFMVNSTSINTCSPFYGEEYMQDPNRYAFTKSEMAAVTTISSIHDNKITTDNEYRKLPFQAVVGQEAVPFQLDVESGGVVVIREYVYTHPFIKGSSEEQAIHMLNSFSCSEYYMVYNNLEVKGYLEK